MTRALLEAIKRYPYLASKLVEKDGDFYIADNRNLSLTVRRTTALRSLGSMAADMRKELGLPHTHKNCVRSMYLPFGKEDAALELEELCTG